MARPGRAPTRAAAVTHPLQAHVSQGLMPSAAHLRFVDGVHGRKDAVGDRAVPRRRRRAPGVLRERGRAAQHRCLAEQRRQPCVPEDLAKWKLWSAGRLCQRTRHAVASQIIPGRSDARARHRDDVARDPAVRLRDEVRVQRAGERPQHIVRDDHDQHLVLPGPDTAPTREPGCLPRCWLSCVQSTAACQGPPGRRAAGRRSAPRPP